MRGGLRPQIRRGRSEVVASPPCCTISIGRFTPRSKTTRTKGEPILAERGVDEEIRRAILSHASLTGVPRVSPLEKTLFACDELAGFITAISYVKPHRSVFEVDVASVKKKMKDKAFARSVNRQDIVEGAAELGVPLEEHIDFCVKAMQEPGRRTWAQGLVRSIRLNSRVSWTRISATTAAVSPKISQAGPSAAEASFSVRSPNCVR